MQPKVTLVEVYREVKEVRRMLESIIEENILASLPTEELSDKEEKEVRRRIQQMKRGEYVQLESSR